MNARTADLVRRLRLLNQYDNDDHSVAEEAAVEIEFRSEQVSNLLKTVNLLAQELRAQDALMAEAIELNANLRRRVNALVDELMDCEARGDTQ